jgi:aarF domain-containing kinase
MRWKGVYDFGNQKITEKIYKTIPQMLKNRLKSPPEQIYSLHRKLSGAYLACIRMRSQVDCHKIFSELRPNYKIQ